MENYKGEVWVSTPDSGDSIFSKGEVIDKVNDDSNLCKVKLLDSDALIDVDIKDLQKANPTRFDGYDDMASLTYLNEASVLNNLKLRYKDDKIYTHSGLFLVAVNPYKKINIYNSDFIKIYSSSNDLLDDGDNGSNQLDFENLKKPHIFGTAQNAFMNLIKENKDQSILVTGESGAGKTENTKKVIQYILSVSTNQNNKDNAVILENQILQANPILESFGNATTVRNLNSSRFGKFIKIQINAKNELSGAHIDWYLLEKSRVIFQDSKERNYHVFYQLLKGAPGDLLKKLLLDNTSIKDYEYLKNGLTSAVDNINDKQDFNDLLKAFKIMNFTELDIFNVFKVLSIILHLGNIQFKNLTNDSKQAVLLEQSENTIEKISTLLGVPSQEFKNSFLNSKIKIGREIVNQQRTANQAKFSLDALSKSLYEKLFQYLIDKINENFKSSENTDDIFLESNNDKYVGILDIAGFEIFEKNSFEQLCINYTNEKLQQFFNHHMFELEQSEYMKEGISWNYIDFGNELKPTIELIEGSQANKKKTNIFSILDEECVVPKGTDKTFIDKLFKELENKDSKIDKATLPFKANKIRDGFIIKHYAGSVDYSVDGWLDKNKDPLSSTMVELLSNSQDIFTSELFNSNSLGFNVTDSPVKGSPRKKSGMFRTVAQRHKEQLTLLMDQLSKTYPHFVRCILPNSEKKPGMFVDKLVLHQLRCNGVLEGIRIARSGYPNRIDFKTFSNHYGILSNTAFSHKKSQSNNDYKYICEVVLDSLDLDPDVYKIGLTKLFFRNGVLASLEKKREEKLNLIFTQFNSIARGKLIRKDFQIKLQRLRASKVLLKNFQLYSKNDADPWFKLIKTLKPRLDDSGMVEVQYKTKINKLENKIKDLKTKIDEELSDREASDSKIQLLEMEISNNKDIIAKKDIEISSSRKTIVNLEKEMTEISESSAETSLILKEKDAKLQELSALNVDNVKKLEENCKELEKNCKEFEESNKKIKIKLESETKLISILKDEILSLKSSLDRKEMELTSLRREKRTRDSSVDEKISDLQSKLNEALNENKTTASDLRKKIELLDTNTGVLQSLQAEHKVTLEELNKLQEITKDYEAKKLAYDQAEKIKKKFKQLKHEFQQTKTLLDQKIKDEIEFNAGRQQYDKELEETKLVIKDLQKELEVEKRATVDLEIKLKHAALETERAIRNNKSLEMDNSQLKLRLRTNNPDQAMLNQYEINMKKSTLSPEVHELREEIRLLRTRLAAESYENRNLKAVIKKGGNSSVYLDNFKISGFNNNSKNQSDTDSSDNSNDIKIFNDHTETDSLKEKLVIEKEANKRLQNHYVKLQKDLMYYKSKYNNNRDSVESNVFGLLDSDSMEYKNKFQMSQIEINDLKEQIKDLRLQLRKNSKFLNNHGNNDTFKTENILNDSTNIENSIVNRAEDTKLKHENLRLSSALNELKTKLHRLELNNGSRFEQEEEIHQLKNNLKTIQLKNSALTSSVELYKGRSEDYYTKLSKAEVELQSSLRERNKLKDDISHLKEKLKRYEVQFDESDRQIQTLSDSIRDLEKQLSDKSFQIEQLTQSYDNLKEKYEDSEELRKSVKSVNHEYQESEIARLNNELTKSVNKETEMAKLMKNMNLQLETCRKEISTAKFNNNEMSREKKVLTKALNDCISKNEGLLGEVKENILKVQNLAQQANVLKVSNDDLLKERDNLLQSKRILEEKLNTITVQFDEHLSRVREDANNAVLVSQLSEKLEKSQHNLSVMNNSLNDLKNKYELVSDELEKVKGDYFQTVEENKELVKFNTSLTNRFNETEKKHEAELKAQDMHWSARINELDEKLFTAQSLQRQENHKYDSFTRTIKDLEIRNKDLERSKKHSEDEIKHLDATIDKLHQNYDSLNKREMEAQLRCKQLARECDKFRELLSLNSNI